MDFGFCRLDLSLKFAKIFLLLFMQNNPKITNPKVIAVIPARGGKQSIPYKNLIKLAGKPLLWWAIDVAKRAEKIDAVTVSTEDKKIAAAAKKYGAIVIERPTEFSQPDSDDSGWYRHAVLWMRDKMGWDPELLVNLRPTGPLRTIDDVNACVDHVIKTNCDGLKTVIPSPIPPFKLWKMSDDKSLRPFVNHPYRKKHGPDIPRQRAQKILPVFWQDAQIDITRPKFILSKEAEKYGNCFGPNLHGFEMDPRKVIDIDTLEDLRQAEKIMKELNKKNKV